MLVSLELKSQEVVRLLMWVLGANLEIFARAATFLTAESSLQPYNVVLTPWRLLLREVRIKSRLLVPQCGGIHRNSSHLPSLLCGSGGWDFSYRGAWGRGADSGASREGRAYQPSNLKAA